MKYMEIGKTGIKASKMGLGAWAAGGDAFWGKQDDEIPVKAMLTAVENGINLIDTAPAYGFGHSEVVVGKALKEMQRDKVIISTKCGLWWRDKEGSPFGARDGYEIFRNLSKRTIKLELEASLKNMNTDYIDIYITHWQSVEPFLVPISETMEALNELKKEGKIRAIGASNVTKEHVNEYMKYGTLDLIQEKYSMLTRVVEDELLPIAKENNITLQAYSPLEQGLLTGKITMDYVVSPAEFRNKIKWYELDKRAKVIALLDSFKPLCEKYNCEVGNLVIAWTGAQGDNVNVLCGGRKQEHVLSNVKAGDITLSKEDIIAMRKSIEEYIGE